MDSGPTTLPHPEGPTNPAEAFGVGLNAWHSLAIGLPLRIAAETIRFTGRRLQAQADHLAALARCGSLKDAVELQTTFLTESVSDYRAEATTLSQDVNAAAFPRAA
ncbi:phasin family protein [Methylobacterium sp. CM6257]